MMSQFTVAVNQSVVTDAFLAAESGFVKVLSGSGTQGALTASYNIGVKLSGGTLAFTNANTLSLSNVNVTDSPCTLELAIQLPNLCTPSIDLGLFTIPGMCLFSSPPVLDFKLDLSNFLVVNLNVNCGLGIKHFNNPNWHAGMSTMDAYSANPQALNAWQIYPVIPNNGINIQISLHGDLGGALDGAINTGVANLVSTLPGYLQPVAWLLIGPAVLFVDAIVGIGADVAQWILSILVGLFDLASVFQTPIAQYFAGQVLFPIPDPIPIQFAEPALPLQPPNPPAVNWNPVFVSLKNPSLAINATEMVVPTDIA